MKKLLNITVFLLTCTLPITATEAARIYKWTDAEGKTHFSDKRPTDQTSMAPEVVDGRTETNIIAPPASTAAPANIQSHANIDSAPSAVNNLHDSAASTASSQTKAPGTATSGSSADGSSNSGGGTSQAGVSANKSTTNGNDTTGTRGEQNLRSSGGGGTMSSSQTSNSNSSESGLPPPDDSTNNLSSSNQKSTTENGEDSFLQKRNHLGENDSAHPPDKPSNSKISSSRDKTSLNVNQAAALSSAQTDLGGVLPIECTQYPPTPNESIEIIDILEVNDAHEELNQGDYHSPLSDWQGAVFLVYVDADWRIKVVKKPLNNAAIGQAISGRVQPLAKQGKNPEPDTHHKAPSIGIDQEGRLHVVAGSHNEPWHYFVSTTPGALTSIVEITASGGPVGMIPGTRVTYPEFQRDTEGTLYITYRDRISPLYWKPGYALGSAAVFSTRSGTWRALGGKNYEVTEYDANQVDEPKALVWDNSGRNGTAYQGYKLRLVFDSRNNMHLSWNVYRHAGKGASHLMYAFSEDSGRTWQTADGTPIPTLPITTANGDVAWQMLPGQMYNLSGLAVGRDEKPLLSAAIKHTRQLHVFDGDCEGWSDPRHLPDDASIKLYSDLAGNITAFSRHEGNHVYRSHDNGRTWRQYTLTFTIPAASRVDTSYLRKSGKIRIAMPKGNTISVKELRFTGDGEI